MAFRRKDNRFFKRYLKKKECRINFGGRPYKATALDYSLSGLGVEVEDGPPVKIGDVLDLEACFPGARSTGKVVWVQKLGGCTKLGLSRLGILTGALEDFSLADVIIGLHRSKKTGLLHVAASNVRKSVYFEGGDPIFASSTDAADRLGEMLLREGKISREQFDSASRVVVTTGKRFGTVLVEAGAISPKELYSGVTKNVEAIIESLFSVKDGQFLFKEEPLPTKEVIKLRLSVGNIIYKGIKRVEDRGLIRDACPPADALVGFSPDPLNLFQDLELEPEDNSLLESMGGKKTVKELMRVSGMDEFHAMGSIVALLSTRIIEVLEAGEEVADISPEAVVGERKGEDYTEVAEKILKLHAEHESLGYYGILGVGKSADKREIKRAYYKMAKEFHPDKHFHLPEDMKDKLNTLFTYLTTAYTTLTNPALRAQYEESYSYYREGPRQTNEQIAAQRFKEGMLALEKGNYADAAQLFGASAYLDGSVAKYHFYSGLALARDGKFRDAERSMSRALKAEPFKAAYLAEAGHIYLALGLPKRARGNFEKALNIDKNNKRALEGMAGLPEEP